MSNQTQPTSALWLAQGSQAIGWIRTHGFAQIYVEGQKDGVDKLSSACITMNSHNPISKFRFHFLKNRPTICKILTLNDVLVIIKLYFN